MRTKLEKLDTQQPFMSIQKENSPEDKIMNKTFIQKKWKQ